MGYQSEAELENKLIEKLKTQGYLHSLVVRIDQSNRITEALDKRSVAFIIHHWVHMNNTLIL